MIIEASLTSCTLIVYLPKKRRIWVYFKTNNRIKISNKKKLNKILLIMAKRIYKPTRST